MEKSRKIGTVQRLRHDLGQCHDYWERREILRDLNSALRELYHAKTVAHFRSGSGGSAADR